MTRNAGLTLLPVKLICHVSKICRINLKLARVIDCRLDANQRKKYSFHDQWLYSIAHRQVFASISRELCIRMIFLCRQNQRDLQIFEALLKLLQIEVSIQMLSSN